jgi:NAD-dependent SIR2 family protein deacetylase
MQETECHSCDAIFLVEHELEEEYYIVKDCPFCATQIIEEEVEWGENEDWDE